MGLMLTLGGSAALAAELASKKSDEALHALQPNGALAFYDRAEFQLVSILADVIIPRTETPGAIDAGVPAYLDKMMATWASEATKASHRRMLADIRARLSQLGGGDIATPVDADRRNTVAALDKEAYSAGSASPGALMPGRAEPETVGGRYRAVKKLIAQVYYLSEPGATKELHYEAVPGRWLPDAPLSHVGRTWAE